MIQAEAGLYTPDPAPRAPEAGWLVSHVLQGRLHGSQPGYPRRPALWPRAQSLQSAVTAAPAPVIQAVAAVVVIEVMAREESQASGAAGGRVQAQVDILQRLQGGGWARWSLGRAGAVSVRREANSGLQRVLSAPRLEPAAGRLGVRAPRSSGGRGRPLTSRPSRGAPTMHRRVAGLTAQARAPPRGAGAGPHPPRQRSVRPTGFRTHASIHPVVEAFFPDPSPSRAHFCG